MDPSQEEQVRLRSFHSHFRRIRDSVHTVFIRRYGTIPTVARYVASMGYVKQTKIISILYSQCSVFIHATKSHVSMYLTYPL
jgi:hypothetical protein